MPFLHRRPRPPLDSSIDSLWFCRNPRSPLALERVLPTGAPQLVINLAEDQTRVYEAGPRGIACTVSPGSTLTGITTRALIIDTAEQEHAAGVCFKPGGTLPFCNTSGLELANAEIPLECLWGRSAIQRLREQLLQAHSPHHALDTLEASLLAACKPRVLHPVTAFALREFAASPSLVRTRAVADAAGLSPKRFIERFKTEIGITPKQYCRLLRFQEAVRAAHSSRLDWTRLAADCGYYDQAHFIHDFREFSGLTPSAYRAASTEFQNHVTFLQSPENRIG
ncbi:MAG: AraC family transcriptional regulator [Bryobacteraceae bacterium]